MSSLQKRNYGIDALRIVSMFMVVVLHVLGRGGVLGAQKQLTTGYGVAWFLEIAAYCAVNCYGLISGYVGVNAKFKYANIMALWLQVVFYTAGISIVFQLVRPETIDIWGALKSLLPVMFKYYWYFTAYFCLFFFIPALNHLLNTMSRQQLKTMLITAFILFSVLQTVFRVSVFKISSNPFGTQSGYSMLWLAFLYMVGGYIRKYGLWPSIKGLSAWVTYGLCVLGTWFSKLGLELLTRKLTGTSSDGMLLVSYISPTILVAAIALLKFFENWSVRPVTSKVIGFMSPLAFSVYLIHTHPLVWNHIMRNRFQDYAAMPSWKMALMVIVTAIGIYLACSCIDLIRHYLFKWMKIRELCMWIEQSLRKRMAKKAETEPTTKESLVADDTEQPPTITVS